MAWRIEVEPVARRAFEVMDASLREEFIERIDGLADNPLQQLRRAWRHEGPSSHVFEYRSGRAPGFTRLVFFDEPDTEKMVLRMVAIAWVATEEFER